MQQCSQLQTEKEDVSRRAQWQLAASPSGVPTKELTLDGPGRVGAQHDADHQGELGGALREGLDEPQHAEVVGQVDGVFGAFLFAPPYPEALTDGRDVPGNPRQHTRTWEPVQPWPDPPSPHAHKPTMRHT